MFFLFLNARYPALGHDYRVYFPFLLEGKWHIAHRGFSPLRYAVHLCGGFPLYGNPNDLFYSITQLFVLAFRPWIAVQLSVFIMLVTGYGGWLLFGRDILRLPRRWRHLFALIVTANGFYFSHIIAGHANFISFPLLGLLFWVLYDRRETGTLSPVMRAAAFTLLTGVVVYSGGYYTMVYFCLMLVLLIPLDLVLEGKKAEKTIRRLWPRLLLCGAGALLIASSKIVAVESLLRSLPYEASMPQISADHSTLWYIAKAFWISPQHMGQFDGVPWQLHEKSLYLSPVVLLGLVASVVLLFRPGRSKMRPWQRMVLMGYSLFLLLVFAQLAQGYGLIASNVFAWPVFSSFRVSMRFLYPFSLWLGMLAVASLACFVRSFVPRRETMVIAASVFLTVAGFSAAYARSLGQFQLFLDDRSETTALLASVERGMAAPVTAITEGGYDFNGKSTLNCPQEPVFVSACNPQARSLHAGPVTDERNGAFNLVNPSCYQYGEENNCTAGNPILLTDRENFERFRAGKSVTWKLSLVQRGADVTSLLAFALCLVAIAYSRLQRSFRRRALVQR